MGTITTSQYNIDHLRASWKSGTNNDWLEHIADRILNIKHKNTERPHPYYGTELLLLAKKLEIIAKDMGGVESTWLDPREI